MIEHSHIRIAPPEEQAICITCGFCCDGTLFSHATLRPGESGNLPEKIEQNYVIINGKEFFKQPCLYFNGRCTIYNEEKAFVCSSYRCQLLRDFADHRISLQNALKVVREAVIIRNEIMQQYKEVSGNCSNVSFSQLLLDLGQVWTSEPENKFRFNYELLQARCNIFEALLIKHIRSSADFESMMIPATDKG